MLLGVTGSGKTFTIAKVIAKINRPTLVLAHNKTLAAQLYQEFKAFFPNNAVEYFVSYYDYYQPEAYVPQSDTYIEKEATINDEIDRLRLCATRSLFERRDVVIVASVSCIYGLGSPEAYYGMLLFVRQGETLDRRDLLSRARRGALRAQRLRARARQLPRARRRGRDRARLRGERDPDRAVRRRGGAHQRLRPAHRQDHAAGSRRWRSTPRATT